MVVRTGNREELLLASGRWRPARLLAILCEDSPSEGRVTGPQTSAVLRARNPDVGRAEGKAFQGV